MDDDTSILRTCTKCGVEKALDQFNRNKSSALGRDTKCRTCKAAYLATRRAADPEAHRASRREYRAKNVERIREQERASATRNRDARQDRQRAYYAANRDAFNEAARQWRRANPERAKELGRRWKQSNPEKAAQAIRAWNKRNPERRMLSQQLRRARIAGSAIGDVDLNDLWTGACGICDEVLDRELAYPDPLSKSIDHIVPLAKGGAHSQDNLQWAHLRCNMAKGDRSA